MKLIAAAVLAAALAACADPWSDASVEAADVAPIDWAAFDTPAPTGDDADRMRAILANATRYALTTWWGSERGAAVRGGALGTGEHDVRPPASQAFALAVALRLGAYDEDAAGVAAGEAEAIAARLVAAVAAGHRSNDPDGWGGGWQTALWAAYVGTAGWLLWDALDPDDAARVARMVQSEAQRLVGYEVPYYRDLAGAIQSRGDSKAEENAWNAQLLYLAANMMPGHAQAPAWEYKAAELAISSYARPADAGAPARVSGRPLAAWLYGSNANEDGTVINHGIVHPDYVVTASYTASAPLWYGLRREPTPEAMFAGTAAAYAALGELAWDPEAAYPGTSCVLSPCRCDYLLRCRASDPGGTIYVPGRADLYFPHGNDWGAGRRMNYAMFDALADAFELDAGLAVPARAWEALHAQAVLDQQLASADRRAYSGADDDTYPGREEWVAVHAAMAWFAKWIVAQGAYGRTARSLDVVVDDRDREVTIEAGVWTRGAPGGQLGLERRRASAVEAEAGARIRWRPALPAGTYAVHAWWAREPDATRRAVFAIAHERGVAAVEVDQRGDGDRWVPLGTYVFDGTLATGAVTLAAPRADGALVADGVRYERVHERERLAE